MVTDGSHTANFTLVGFDPNATLTFESDGHGGTLILDPPKQAATVAAPAADAGDQFRFAFLSGGGGADTGPHFDWLHERAASGHASLQGGPPAPEDGPWMADIGHHDHLPHLGMTAEQLQLHLTSGVNLH
jgi:hypothetical protein